jgi:beta-xylosidase
MPTTSFAQRLVDPCQDHVFRMEGYFVWDGSLIRDDDGRYHLFASRWPEDKGMRRWLTDSKVVRAESDSPTGPFEFKEQLDVLNEQPWAANMAHNPRTYRIGDTYYLYYIGTHWGEFDVEAARDGDRSQWEGIRFNQRIGIASAPHPSGPWTPYAGNPVLEPRPDCWDAKITVNPSVEVLPSGQILMIYKSTLDMGQPLILGAAIADQPEGPFERTGPSPLFEDNVEDPCFWEEDGRQWMLVKDMTGKVCGVRHAGVLYHSTDGLNWELAEPSLAYDLMLRWQDGEAVEARYVERPFVYLEDGKPRCLLNAVLYGDQSSGVLVRELNG